MSDSLETNTLQDRINRLQELTEFTENCKEQLHNIFQSLGWSQDYKQEPMAQCPYDPNHRVPCRTLEKHKVSCRLRRLGYSAEEQEAMCDTTVCYENTNVRTFTMDQATQHQVIRQAQAAAPLMRMEGVFWQGQFSSEPVEVPQNHKRALCDLTVADRLALYNHVTGVLSQQQDSSNKEDLYVDLVAKLKRGEDQNEPKSHLELMAEMRDYKRRRQSYRAKNVHITKKSYTEVIREVINVHSGELARQWGQGEGQEEGQEEEQEVEQVEEQVEEEVSSTRSHVRSSQRWRPEGGAASPQPRPNRPDTHSRQDQSLDRDRSRDKSQDRSQEQESRKKRRRRSSHSPDDRHHDRKKKKKKKRNKSKEENE